MKHEAELVTCTCNATYGQPHSVGCPRYGIGTWVVMGEPSERAKCATCGHIKALHYFGDALGSDGRMHTRCQTTDGCQDFVRATAAPQPALTAWLIERGQTMHQVPTVWWAGDGAAESWTTDAFAAIHFPTKESAEFEIRQHSPRPSNPFGAATSHGFVYSSLEARGGAAQAGLDGTDSGIEVLNRLSAKVGEIAGDPSLDGVAGLGFDAIRQLLDAEYARLVEQGGE